MHMEGRETYFYNSHQTSKISKPTFIINIKKQWKLIKIDRDKKHAPLWQQLILIYRKDKATWRNQIKALKIDPELANQAQQIKLETLQTWHISSSRLIITQATKTNSISPSYRLLINQACVFFSISCCIKSAASWTVVMFWELSSSTLMSNSSSKPITISTCANGYFN